MSAVAWPDVLCGALLVFGALKGFKRGLVSELAGLIALGVALVAAWLYPGMWDAGLAGWTHAGAGTAHVIGMVLYAGTAYAAMSLLASFLNRAAKLPLINVGNAVLGALVGLTKAAIFVWALVYVALFFPLSRDLRTALHRSHIVAVLEAENPQVDGALRAALPSFVQPYAEPLFARHRV
ncbi:MAG: CvpA family protein [Vulcanimicrobiaceae bacterium]